jgi:hypothetical protein
MIWRKAVDRIRRSKYFGYIVPIFDLARASFVALLRYSRKDYETLLAYFYRLQQHQFEANIIFDRTPIVVLGTINQRAMAAKIGIAAILSDFFGWLPIGRGPRMDDGPADARVFGTVRSSLRRVLRWPWRKVRGVLVRGVMIADVATMHSFARTAIYDLVIRYGDVAGALAGFEMLAALRSHPKVVDIALDRLMWRLLSYLQQVENDIVKINKPKELWRTLVISVVIWGDDHVNRFMRYALASLMTPGNLPGLAKDCNVIWHVFTTAKDRAKLAQNPAFATPYKVLFEIIPNDLIELATNEGGHWLDDGLTQMSFRLAERMGADIHFFNPDTVYSRDYFTSLYKIVDTKRPKIILANSFRTDRDTVLAALDAIRDIDGTIALDPRSLCSLGLSHIHESSRATFVTEVQLSGKSIPRSPTFMWHNGNDITIHSARCQSTFVSNELVRRGTKRSHFAGDGAIYRKWPRIVAANTDTYMAQPTDDIGYFEINSNATLSIDQIDRRQYVQEFWKTNKESEFQVLGRACRLPVSQWSASLPQSAGPAMNEAFFRLYEEIRLGRPEFEVSEQESNLTIADLVGKSDAIFGLEVRKGCGPMVESLIDDLRTGVTENRTCYEGVAVDNAYLARLYVNFLRLGLLEELKMLCERHKFHLGGATEFLNAVVNLCSDRYKQAARAGIAWKAKQAVSERFTLSCTVWGEEYVQNFMNFNVRSMLGPGNLPALAKMGECKFFVITNENGRAAIETHPVFVQASKYAAWEFVMVPQPVITELVSPAMEQYFYVLYGMLDHIGIFFAQGADSNLFMIPVDSIVADGSFVNIVNYRNEGFECCGGGNIVANTETFLPALDKKFSGQPAIAISTKDLASLAIKHAHHYFISQLISAENADFGMHARELFWPVPGGVEIHSCFIHPLFVAASALARYKRKHYANVDYGMIPRIFDEPDRIKIISNTDEAYINNFASGKRRFETTGNPFEYAIFLKAHHYTYPVQKALFVHRQTLWCDYKGITANRNAEVDVEVLSKQLREARPGA